MNGRELTQPVISLNYCTIQQNTAEIPQIWALHGLVVIEMGLGLVGLMFG